MEAIFDNYVPKYGEVPIEYEIDPKELKFAFQPIWDVKNHEKYGYECLMRPYRKAPMDYINAYEKAGRLDEIEGFTALYGIQAFLEAGLEGHIFLNSFPSSCASLEVVSKLKELQCEDMMDRIVIEVLEYTKHERFAWAMKKRVFEQFGLKMRIAIDDFGTGRNEDLKCLEIYKPDIVKIDRAYITEIHRHYWHQKVVKAMCDGGHANGIKILAEGVETEEEYRYLLPMVDYMQGYYLGKPKIYD